MESKYCQHATEWGYVTREIYNFAIDFGDF